MSNLVPSESSDSTIARVTALQAGMGLALAYPLLAHLAVYFRSLALTCFAAAILLLMVLQGPLRAGRAWAWLMAALGAILLVLLTLESGRRDALYALYLAPVLIYLFLAWFFGRTLVRGSRPLIARMAWHMHGQPAALEPQIQTYTRQLTALWTGAFLVLATVNALLALFATPDGVLELLGLRTPLPIAQTAWSLFANFFSFALVLVLFAAEFLYRGWRFPEERQRFRGLVDFLSHLRLALPGMWRDLSR